MSCSSRWCSRLASPHWHAWAGCDGGSEPLERLGCAIAARRSSSSSYDTTVIAGERRSLHLSHFQEFENAARLEPRFLAAFRRGTQLAQYVHTRGAWERRRREEPMKLKLRGATAWLPLLICVLGVSACGGSSGGGSSSPPPAPPPAG